MTIIRDRELRQFCCDKCGDTGHEFDQSDFNEAKSEHQRDGWRFEKTAYGGEWSHYCKRCAALRAGRGSAKQEFTRR